VKTTSANRDAKVYIGALAGHDGTGYVNDRTLSGYIRQAQETWSSFGGVILREALLTVNQSQYNQHIELHRLLMTNAGQRST
jgi:chitinase